MTARVVLLSNTLDQTTDGQHAQPLELDPDSRKLYGRFILIDHPVPRWAMLVTIFDVRLLVAARDCRSDGRPAEHSEWTWRLRFAESLLTPSDAKVCLARPQQDGAAVVPVLSGQAGQVRPSVHDLIELRSAVDAARSRPPRERAGCRSPAGCATSLAAPEQLPTFNQQAEITVLPDIPLVSRDY